MVEYPGTVCRLLRFQAVFQVFQPTITVAWFENTKQLFMAHQDKHFDSQRLLHMIRVKVAFEAPYCILFAEQPVMNDWVARTLIPQGEHDEVKVSWLYALQEPIDIVAEGFETEKSLVWQRFEQCGYLQELQSC